MNYKHLFNIVLEEDKSNLGPRNNLCRRNNLKKHEGERAPVAVLAHLVLCTRLDIAKGGKYIKENDLTLVNLVNLKVSKPSYNGCSTPESNREK